MCYPPPPPFSITLTRYCAIWRGIAHWVAKAKGRGHVRLKCLGNLDGLPADAASMRLRLAVAHPDSAFEKAMCNIVKHDFSENAVCTLRKAGVEEDHMSSVVPRRKQSALRPMKTHPPNQEDCDCLCSFGPFQTTCSTAFSFQRV